MTRPAGRPRASSRETLADAACELFFEQGYTATSITDITQRAGVSRASFFNYFSGKSDIFWWSLDEQITAFTHDLAQIPVGTDPELNFSSFHRLITNSLLTLADSITPDTFVLALSNADTMGAHADIERDLLLRQGTVARTVEKFLMNSGVPTMLAEVTAAGYGAAVIAALREWVRTGPMKSSLRDVLSEAVAPVKHLLT